jgi:hypothetical protein
MMLLGCAAGAGCVDRRIFITSDPSGARVYLNDQDVGLTPLEVNFTWFGTYDVRVRKAGYEPLVTTREAKAPLHEVPPFDLAALAIPGTKTTHIDWHFELQPATNDPVALLERAEQLRAEAESKGEGEPVPKEVTPPPPDETATEPPDQSPVSAPANPGPDVIEVTPTTPTGSSSPE